MVTEIVNGELRQVFQFKRGRFYAPPSLGAGYRKDIVRAKANNIIVSDEMVKLVAEAAKRPQKKGLPDEMWRLEVKDDILNQIIENVEIKESLLASVQDNSMRDDDLAVLKVLLTPAPGSPTVEKWYKELSEESEVEEVINFSNGVSENKTETEHSQNITGEDSTTEKPDSLSETTSPEPITGKQSSQVTQVEKTSKPSSAHTGQHTKRR